MWSWGSQWNQRKQSYAPHWSAETIVDGLLIELNGHGLVFFVRRVEVPRYYIPGHFIFSWHFIPKGKMHYIPNDTSSNMPLHPLVHFIPNGTSSQVHFISKSTSSHSALHLISHFISQVISSHMLLHPIRHFIPPVISSHTSLQPMTHSLWVI